MSTPTERELLLSALAFCRANLAECPMASVAGWVPNVSALWEEDKAAVDRILADATGGAPQPSPAELYFTEPVEVTTGVTSEEPQKDELISVEKCHTPQELPGAPLLRELAAAAAMTPPPGSPERRAALDQVVTSNGNGNLHVKQEPTDG